MSHPGGHLTHGAKVSISGKDKNHITMKLIKLQD